MSAKKRAVLVFSGGLDSACACAVLGKKYRLYGITFSYGQRARRELAASKRIGKMAGLVEHRTVDIGFMGSIYGRTNVLTDSSRRVPAKFDYSIVVPIRNAVFLSIASAWAYTLGAALVGYGAHTGDSHYPDCRPAFASKLEAAFNAGESDGIRAGRRRKISVWSPYKDGLSKSALIREGHAAYGAGLFGTWSCYLNGRRHCGRCESCQNRKAAFARAGVEDLTGYAA